MTLEESPVAQSVEEEGSPLAIADPRSTQLLVRQASSGHAAATARPAASQNPSRDTFERELVRGIRKLADRRYEIKRGTLKLALANIGLLSRSVRAAPEVRDGKSVGFRLFAIVADGPFAKLGLRDDDVLISINGLGIATADQVLNAYGKLKTAHHLALGLIREGREITQDYTIR